MRLFKRGKIWFLYFYEAGVRIQRSTRCTDRKAAEIVARRLERDAADPDHAAARNATLGQALKALVDHREELARVGKRSVATASFYRDKVGHWTRLLETNDRGEYAAFVLRDLRAHHVDGYISRRRAEGVSEHTIAKELTALRAALKLAKRAGLWRGDPAEVCPIAFAPEYKPRERALRETEVDALIAALPPDRAARVAFIVATSACWSETEHARRGDAMRDLSQVLIRGTKRRARLRHVPVVSALQRRLLAFALEHAGGEGEALFAPWSNVRRDLTDACVRAGIERCSPNDLRRTCATLLRAAGARVDDLAPLMGHADSRMLVQVYARLSTRELAHRIEESLDPVHRVATTPSHASTVEPAVVAPAPDSPAAQGAPTVAAPASTESDAPASVPATQAAPTVASPVSTESEAPAAAPAAPDLATRLALGVHAQRDAVEETVARLALMDLEALLILARGAVEGCITGASERAAAPRRVGQPIVEIAGKSCDLAVRHVSIRDAGFGLANCSKSLGISVPRDGIEPKARGVPANYAFLNANLVPRDGIEPPTRGFSILCSTN